MNGSNIFESTRLNQSDTDANGTLSKTQSEKILDSRSENDSGFNDGNDTETFVDNQLSEQIWDSAIQPLPPDPQQPLPSLPANEEVTNEPNRDTYDLTSPNSKTTSEHLEMTERVNLHYCYSP